VSEGVAYRAGIQVTLKPSVLDPQGAAVAGALGKLGFDGVTDVRVGRYVELRLTAPDAVAARATVERMCETLLANLVIERYAFSLTEDSLTEEAR
jgi:phosphoribosylformylglycinamidine synthase PurS subunit